MYYFDKDNYLNFKDGDSKCFCLPNGLGGYTASSIINSSHRKHHGYLVASLKSPVERMMILARINESVQFGSKIIDLEAQHYDTGIKEGQKYLEEFSFDYVPTYVYQVQDVNIKKKIAPLYNANTVGITYEILAKQDCSVFLEPLFNYRDHGQASNPEDLLFTESVKGNTLTLIPDINPNCKIKFNFSEGSLIFNENKVTDGLYCEYDVETGDPRLDHHYKPARLRIDLHANTPKLVSVVCTIDRLPKMDAFGIIIDYEDRCDHLIRQSKITDSLGKDLVVSADTFICKRESTKLKTILAGLPWFTDWGRDTMIAFTGLTLATRRFKDAKEILKSFSLYEKDGLIPNMFPEEGAEPLYNTVDASLWYFYAVYKYVNYTQDYEFVEKEVYPVLKKIIKAYHDGTAYSIGMDSDGLIHAGSDLDQVTWMDVRVNGIVVTPRHGKPVEINALWYNALMIMTILAERFGDDYNWYRDLAMKVEKSFNDKFFCDKTGCLYDTVDPFDSSVRPNQIWVLSLPFKLLDLEKAKKVFKVVENELYNVYGLRSLSPKDTRFKPKYEGDLLTRDFAYHMGTTWGFLIGGYLDAYAYVHEYSEEAINEIDDLVHRFIPHLNDGCINGIAEIFDGDIASRTRGCYTQAWSVGELLRAYYENVLMEK